MSYGGAYGTPSGPPPGYAPQQQSEFQQQHGYAQHRGGYAPPPGRPGPGPGPGGFTAPPPAGPPPGSDPQLWAWFSSVDSDNSGAISADELQRALMNGDWTSFDLDTVKLLMTIFDTDRSGTIGFNEFSGLWKYVKDWQNVFRHFDRDRSGSIDGHELHAAMKQFGYNLSPHLIHLVERKYGPATTTTSREGINFDRFVRACVVIKQLTESFQKLDTDGDGWVQFNYNGFMETVLSAP